MRLQELISNLDYRRVDKSLDCEIKGISCNSACIRPGYLFVAIKGSRLNGHSFVKQAIDKGAKAIILQEDLALHNEVTKILVPDSQTALAYACASFFGHPTKSLKVIGITGTNGKTTVSYLIEKILASAKVPCGVIGTVNYRSARRKLPALNTTPQADTLQRLMRQLLLDKSRYAIMEVSSHALRQRRVEAIDFCSAIFTNLSKEHLDYHRSLTNYFSSKARLFERLTPGAWAIINADEDYGRKLIKITKAKVLTYGIEQAARIQARDLSLNLKRSRFRVLTPKGEMEILSPLIGRHNVYNILAAISAAFIEEIKFSDIVSGIKGLGAVPGRLERIDCGQQFSVFVDYAHTVDGLEKILWALKPNANNKIILVFGCGGDRDKTKRPLMGRLATKLSDFVIITSDNPRSERPQRIIADILQGISRKANNYKVILDRFQAIQEALSMARKGNIVVIAGKGHECSQLFANKTIPFNDSEAVRKILLTNKRTYV